MTHAQEGKWKKRYKKGERKRVKRKQKKKKIGWRKRLKAVRYALKHGMEEASDIFKVCIRTLYRWRKRYLDHGSKGLYNRSRRPKNPRKVSDEIVKQVIYIRDRYETGCEKIAIDLGISPSTVHKILKKAGMNKVRKKKRVVIKHYERKHSNSLWQLDYSQIYDDPWILLIIDDHSRFLIGYKLMKAPNTEDTLDLLQECFGKYGVPKQLLTDHGSQFYSVRGGVSTFSMFCIENYIRHILARIRHPQTCGKIERKFGIIKEHLERYGAFEKRLPKAIVDDIVSDYIQYHNYSRIHFTYQYWTFGDVKVKKKRHFIPFLRFAAHRV